MIYKLSKDIVFPHPELSDDDGLLAFGGDLSIKRLLLAYRNGIFPWYSNDEPILWYSPNPRFILYPDHLHISKSMKSFLQKKPFTIRSNTAFETVIRNCKTISRPNQDDTWITDEMLNAYILLHKQGFAHSIEVWQQTKLVGGIYGIALDDLFFGESMFSLVSNASKSALIALVQTQQFNLIDCQVHTKHLASMGATHISRKIFLDILSKRKLKKTHLTI